MMILLFAIISVCLALIFYSTSIFRELRGKKVTAGILVFFWLGLFFDLAGTCLMILVSKGFSFNFHSIIGVAALALMGVKAVWATTYYRRGSDKRMPVEFTIFSWSLWVLVFFLGFFR